jgi:hypothetical protein
MKAKMRMEIEFDAEKVAREGKWKLDSMYAIVDEFFVERGLPILGRGMYGEAGTKDEYAMMGYAICRFREEEWFTDNASRWDWLEQHPDGNIECEDILGGLAAKGFPTSAYKGAPASARKAKGSGVGVKAKMRMEIEFDAEKVAREGKWKLDSMYAIVDEFFAERGLPIRGRGMYGEAGTKDEYAMMGYAICRFRECEWFTDNASRWDWLEQHSDGSIECEDILGGVAARGFPTSAYKGKG